MRNLLMIAIAVTSQAVIAAGSIYSWTDESGNLIYGDTPPDNISAEVIDPPKLTVLEGFSTRYQTDSVTSSQPASTSASKSNAPAKKVVYTELRVIAPKKDQAIRANDGDVSIALGLSPKLRPGDKIVISLDGKEFSRGTSRVANLSNLDRGEHTLIVSVVNRAARSLISSGAVTFNVLRNSALINKPYSPYPDDPNAVKPFNYSNN